MQLQISVPSKCGDPCQVGSLDRTGVFLFLFFFLVSVLADFKGSLEFHKTK